MAEKKIIEIDVDIIKAQVGLDNFKKGLKDSESGAKSLKTQIREAQNEVAELSEKFGATSKEAIEAAKRAGQLKDKIGDAKSLTDAFNPDTKFKSLGASLTVVSGGFSAVTGGMALLGGESKDVEQAILKVQAAMSLASGAQSVGESVDSFKQLGSVVKSFSIVQKVVTAGQWLFNAAMAANPIGAIVVLVVALISAGYALVKMFQSAKAQAEASALANKKLNDSLNSNIKAQEKANTQNDLSRDSQLRMAKASGASAKEIRKLSEELANQEVKQKIANAETLRAIFIEARRVAGLEDATEAQKETAKVAYKAFQDSNKLAETAVLNRRKLAIDNRVAERQEQTDGNKKALENQKKANEDELQNRKDALKKAQEEEKSAIEEKLKNTKLSFEAQRDLVNADKKLAEKDRNDFIKKINEEEKLSLENHKKAVLELENKYKIDLENLNAKNEQEKLDLQKKRDIAELEKIAYTAEENFNLRMLLDEKYKILQDELDTKTAEEKFNKEIEKKALDASNEAYEFETRLALLVERDNLILANTALTEEQRTKLLKENSDARTKIEAAEYQFKKAQLNETAGLLESVGSIIGKQTAAGKALGIASALINTYVGVTEALKQKSTLPSPFDYAAKAINVAAVLGTGFKAVKAITSVKVPGGGGGGGGAPSASGISAGTSAPSFNVVGAAGLDNQIATGLATNRQAPVKAFVVANDVTTQAAADRNIVKNASLG